MSSLKAHFRFEPCSLKFGTSGRRGLVAEMPQVEIYVNALAEIEYLQSLGPEEGGIVRGEEFYFASDLRPTSSRFMEEFGGNGELAYGVIATAATNKNTDIPTANLRWAAPMISLRGGKRANFMVVDRPWRYF